MLSFAEVETFLMIDKTYALLVYERGRERFRKGDREAISVDILRGLCRKVEQELKIPIPGMIVSMLHSRNLTDTNSSRILTADEFRRVILGCPEKQLQAVRDMVGESSWAVRKSNCRRYATW